MVAKQKQNLCIVMNIIMSFIYTALKFDPIAFQCLILSLKTFHVIIRYGMHLYDLHHDGVWENRGIYVYYLEFMFEMTILSIDFMHHLHMLVSSTMCNVLLLTELLSLLVTGLISNRSLHLALMLKTNCAQHRKSCE